MQYVIVGTGGQGILFSSKVLGHVAMERKENVQASEVHGMAQRGGSVVSHFKVGDYRSPLVKVGDADILLAFDQTEAVRSLHYLRDGGDLLVNVHDEEALENSHLQNYLKKHSIRVHKMKGYDILTEHMNGRFLFMNTLILGAMCGAGVGGVKTEEVRKAIRALAPARFVDDNLKVFDLGCKAFG